MACDDTHAHVDVTVDFGLLSKLKESGLTYLLLELLFMPFLQSCPVDRLWAGKVIRLLSHDDFRPTFDSEVER